MLAPPTNALLHALDFTLPTARTARTHHPGAEVVTGHERQQLGPNIIGGSECIERSVQVIYRDAESS